MGNLMSKNDFQTVLVTGGSQGMGKEVGRQLAEKGANIVIVARNPEKLKQPIEYIKEGAIHPSVAWNNGHPPDTVFCCAGTSYPTLFIDTPVSKVQEQMQSNYFTSAYMAHAAISTWYKPLENRKNDFDSVAINKSTSSQRARHIIFTASFLALYAFAGYAAYSPSKAALRSVSDSLSQEMKLYEAAYPNEPPVRVHTIFPATILTESYENENKIKHGLTKQLEEGDAGQTPQVVAERSIRNLERGQELITTDMLTGLVKHGVLGGSPRGGFWRTIMGWVLSGLMGIVMVFVRMDMDSKAKAWGRKFGVADKK